MEEGQKKTHFGKIYGQNLNTHNLLCQKSAAACLSENCNFVPFFIPRCSTMTLGDFTF